VTLQGLPVAGSAADPPPAATTVTLSNGALIQTQTSGPGSGGTGGGTVSITADSLTLENGSFIITANSELGLVGGDISLNVGELHLLGDPSGDPLFGSQILSINSTGTDLDGNAVTGVGGKITVQGIKGAGSVADKVEISGGSGIVSETQNTSGDGGRISITANFLDLLGEASIIRSITSAFGTDLDGDGVVDVPGGRGGDIVLAVQDLRVAGLAAIRSDTISPDQAAADGGSVTVQGLDGQGSKASSVLLSGPNTGIFSDSASGVAGDLTVNAGTLTITNGAVISAGSSTSSGPAGKVTVTAGSVVISADGQIFSRSFAQSSGQVTITADALTLDNGSIDTSTSNATGSRGGDVVLNGGTVSLTNGASINSQSGSEEDQGRFSTGRAGDITMNVGSLTLEGHSEITSSSKGTVVNAGDAGNITTESGTTVVLNNSAITTEASVSSGGQIEINAPEMVRLTDSEVSTSVKGVSGGSDGGNIKIDPQFVILQNSQLTAQANAGAGGAINVIAGVFLADPNSLVSASSQSGPQGTVNIQSPVQNIGGELAPMSEEFASAVALLAQQCAARVADGKFSTFVVSGREGLPAEPGGFLASPSLTAELFGSGLSGRDRHSPFPAVTGTFPEYEARPIQLAKFGNACHQ
jgi:large exoprotein involved in heme utilization and adhesion